MRPDQVHLATRAKGRVERSFHTAQDRLVKEMRVKGIGTLEQANEFLVDSLLPWCNQRLKVAPANSDNTHRPLEPCHDLAAILSHLGTRRVASDYSLQFASKLHQIARQDIRRDCECRREGGEAAR